MFDIDNYLDKIAIKEVSPSDELITRTLSKCSEVAEQKEKLSKAALRIKKAVMIAVPAAAILLIGILIGSQLFPVQGAAVEVASAYYTVDINPSVCVNVDQDSIVTGLVGQNDDAKALIKQLDCVGKPAIDAIKQIIEAAKQAGYLSDEQKYVLVGCFGISDENAAIDDLQAQLEQDFGDMIDLLIVSGSLEDKMKADELNVSAGLLQLSRMAQGVEPQGHDKVADLVDEVKNNFSAPTLSVSETANGVKLSWSELDFAAMGYSGDVKYHIAVADTAAEIESLSADTVKTFSFKAGDKQNTSYRVTPDNSTVKPGALKYYGVYVQYGSVAKLVSNVVSAVMPQPAQATDAPTPSATASTEPTQAPEPTSDQAVSGRVSGDGIVIKWRKETSSQFAGYKIVASKTNERPKYPEDGYLKFITDRETTSVTLYESGSLKAGQSYYFSVTYLYSDGSAVAGNAVKLQVPSKSVSSPTSAPTEAPPPPAGDYPSTSISGSMDGNTARLSWGQISHPSFEGYKVVCSFSSSSPRYPDNGYVAWITDAGRTSCSVDMTTISGYAPGIPCYFAITALYDNHNVKKTGNTLTLTMPAVPAPDATPAPTPEPVSAPESYVSSNISGGMSSGTTASFSWDKVTHGEFEGYKLVYSFSNSSPKYPDSDYAAWITDANSTSRSVDVTSLKGYTPGATCYFSITVLYGGHKVFKAGNSVAVVVP